MTIFLFELSFLIIFLILLTMGIPRRLAPKIMKINPGKMGTGRPMIPIRMRRIPAPVLIIFPIIFHINPGRRSYL